VSIDCPYTWSDEAGCAAETRAARRLGYTAKSAVLADHVAVINGILTPTAAEVALAARVVEAFETARNDGLGRVEMDGSVLELPTVLQARRILERAGALGVAP
jgi:citrate lyase subunit beta/citryl-CoA lyase